MSILIRLRGRQDILTSLNRLKNSFRYYADEAIPQIQPKSHTDLHSHRGATESTLQPEGIGAIIQMERDVHRLSDGAGQTQPQNDSYLFVPNRRSWLKSWSEGEPYTLYDSLIKEMNKALETFSGFSDRRTKVVRRQRMRRLLEREGSAELYDDHVRRDWDRRRLGELKGMNLGSEKPGRSWTWEF